MNDCIVGAQGGSPDPIAKTNQKPTEALVLFRTGLHRDGNQLQLSISAIVRNRKAESFCNDGIVQSRFAVRHAYTPLPSSSTLTRDENRHKISFEVGGYSNAKPPT
ncbi:hypothetical protein [Rhizobium acaciae]|uniref:hypothetical protein n=1 Tax=Rhizobium acaciae TaxID=2989736 RepID=UPI0012F940B1